MPLKKKIKEIHHGKIFKQFLLCIKTMRTKILNTLENVLQLHNEQSQMTLASSKLYFFLSSWSIRN